MPYNLPPPPSGITGELRDYLERVRKALNATPVFSWGSFALPTSNVSGELGDFFINTGSASTYSRLFMKAAPEREGTASNVSWAVVRMLPL